ncbi:MAG: DUF4271 domain-containing protein [Bacteroidales bacterium]|nr:DUF4271 domain-containing protein [Bacteroidales bacterium]
MHSFFENHQLAFSGFNPELVSKGDPWATILICAALFLLTLVVVPFRRKCSLILRALFSQRHFSLLTRESKILQERVFVFMLLFDVMVFALGALMLLRQFRNPLVDKLSTMGTFGVLFAIMLGVYWLKFLFNFIYTSLFDHPKDLYPINLYKFIFITDAAIVLFPVLAIVQFAGFFPLLYAYIPVFCVLFVLFSYKLLKINPRQVNLLKLFL